MGEGQVNTRASFKERLICLLISNLVFYVIYNFAGYYSSKVQYVQSFVLDFEKYIPFTAWMIIPYMSSGLFFAAVFFIAKTKNDLYVLTKRINFISILSGLLFLIIPLENKFLKPEVQHSILSIFFDFINTWDTKYNQAPSLHISYAIVFASVIFTIKSKKLRIILYIWILLMAISTLTIYQHHLIDIISSFVLVGLTFCVFPKNKEKHYKVGLFYTTGTALILLIVTFCYKFTNSIALLIFLLWLTVVFCLIAIAYFRKDNHFLKNEDGKIAIVKKVFYSPYLVTYRLMRKYFCKNNKKSVTEIYPSLFIGPKLQAKELREIGFDIENTIIIDLMAEAEDCPTLRKNGNYYSFPILDISNSNDEYTAKLIHKLSTIYKENNTKKRIYLHCLMGYSRSTSIACLFLSNQLGITTQEATIQINKKYKNSIIYKHLLSL